LFNNADLAINVIDIRQGWLQKIIAGLLNEFDDKGNKKQYIHLGYEIVSLSKETAKELGIEVGDKDFVHMSGRAGVYINADDVLDKLKNIAYQETKSRNPDANEEWLVQISESISVGAIRYSLIKQDIGKILVFDLRETLKLEGETGPYLQYTYARASSILEKYGKPVPEPDVVDTLTEQEERLLIRELSKIDIVIEETIENLQPNRIATYTYSICLLFNTFYEKYSVLHEENEKKKIQRLLLVKAFIRALTSLMNILGIEGHKRI
jgi:arginyl-tRNA synthetase